MKRLQFHGFVRRTTWHKAQALGSSPGTALTRVDLTYRSFFIPISSSSWHYTYWCCMTVCFSGFVTLSSVTAATRSTDRPGGNGRLNPENRATSALLLCRYGRLPSLPCSTIRPWQSVLRKCRSIAMLVTPHAMAVFIGGGLSFPHVSGQVDESTRAGAKFSPQ